MENVIIVISKQKRQKLNILKDQLNAVYPFKDMKIYGHKRKIYCCKNQKCRERLVQFFKEKNLSHNDLNEKSRLNFILNQNISSPDEEIDHKIEDNDIAK